MKKENNSKNAVFLCTICQQEFRKIEIYDKHCIETHSNSVDKKKRGSPKKNIHENANKCEICGKSFVNSGNLTKHLKIHQTDKINLFECHQCGKTFKEKYNFKRHVKSVHEEERPHKCDYCDHWSKSKFDLKSHIKSGGNVSYVLKILWIWLWGC